MTTSQATLEGPEQPPQGGDEMLPTLTTAVIDAKATRETMFTLRHFHLGDPAARERLDKVADDYLPALLNPYRDVSRLRYNYPLVLFPPEDAAEREEIPERLAQSLDEWLGETCISQAPEQGEARILKDHLDWLEYRVREQLLDQMGPVDAGPVLELAGTALVEHLGLSEDGGRQLAEDADRLLSGMPKQGQLLGYDRYAALHLLIHTVRCQLLPLRGRFRAQIDARIRGLKGLFDVEWEKSDESIEPRMARNTIGFASEHFDPAALSAVMDHSRGTHQMSPARRQRIEDALATLESWEPDRVLIHFVHYGDLDEGCLRGYDFCEQSVDQDPCDCAVRLFDQSADQLAPVFSAMRVAELEIAGRYDPLIHDPWFANFHWSAFSLEELKLIPTVVALGSATHLAGEGLPSLSRLLSSGRPVQILIRVQPHNNPGATEDQGPFQSFRTEMGYLGISHRQAVVCQSSPARHDHLLGCYRSSLETMRTSLHIVNTGLRPPGNLVRLNAWMVAGAAIESRAHPFFRINPEAGDSAAEHMDFSENPKPEVDWPDAPFRYRDENGEITEIDLGFTFADYALLIERLRDQFRIVPPGCDSAALVPVETYLSMDQEQNQHLVPFVWAVDANQTLHRLVVSIDVTNGARDRRNFWHTLQEMAGIRNRYVDLAIASTRDQERRRAETERDNLLAQHAAELERVRTQAASEAMQRLTDTLLGLDTSLPAQPAAMAAPAASAEAHEEAREAQPETAPGETAETVDSAEPEEPWIDTPLCTSCNDCLQINTRLFLYNEEKQARIGDPHNGTFAELVEAAELCPAKCIHPGTPLNPDEPGLEALMERAAPFNI